MADKSEIKAMLAKPEAEKYAKALKNTQNRELSDEEMNDIVGGYKEGDKNLQSYGLEVYCPNCLNSDSGKIGERVYNDPELHTTEYHCNACGTDFVVDKDLHASIEKNYYKQLVPSYKW